MAESLFTREVSQQEQQQQPPPPAAPPRRSAWSLVKLATLVAVLVAGGWVLYRYDPTRAGFFPPCPFYALTGFYCAGCGSTRCMHQLVHGNLWAAFRFNPLLILFLPMWAYEFVRYVRRTLRPPPPAPLKYVHPIWIWGMTALIMTYWVARNIPVRPFSWLAPTQVSTQAAVPTTAPVD